MFTGLLPSTPGLRTPVHQGLRCNSTDRFASLEFLPVIAPGCGVGDFMAELEKVVETASDALMAEAGFVRAG